jgi:repressor LexA
VASLQGDLLGRTIDAAADDGEAAPTERQMEIYAFIRDKIHSRGYGPTVREIGEAFRIRSPNGVVCHLKALERKGLITRGKNMSRAIELMAEPAHVRGLPLAGWVAAGTLRPAEEQHERIDFESLFKKWFPERDRIRLQPANAAMKPIYVKNARVLGVLVGVVRKTG